MRGNIAHAGPTNWTRSLVWFVIVWSLTPLNQLLLVAIGMLVCLPGVDRLAAKRGWRSYGLLVYGGASLVAVCRVRYLFVHHAIFLVPPVIYMLADATPPKAGEGLFRSSSARVRAATFLCLTAIVSLYMAYAIRYGYMIKGIRALSRETVGSMMSTVPDLQVRSGNLLDNIIGPSQWVLPDWNERIAFAVGKIRQKYHVQTLMIWGVAPAVYPLTHMTPATRDTIAGPVKEGTLRTYYTERLLADLHANPPDLFIDAVCRGMRRFDMTENDSYESVPELREFVDNNYALVATLPVIKGSKPVRFFLRRSPAAAHDASGSRQGH